jgi:hypothetical protein
LISLRPKQGNTHKEDTQPIRQIIADIHHTEIIDTAWIVTSLKDTNHESIGDKLSFVLDKAMGDGKTAPADHNDRKPVCKAYSGCQS